MTLTPTEKRHVKDWATWVAVLALIVDIILRFTANDTSNAVNVAVLQESNVSIKKALESIQAEQQVTKSDIKSLTAIVTKVAINQQVTSNQLDFLEDLHLIPKRRLANTYTKPDTVSLTKQITVQ